MTNPDPKFQSAIDRFDASNAEDPNKIDGTPAELLYARRMTDWLNRLYPDAPEPLKLAARSQHLRRWEIPRSAYPITRQGYYKWRTTLYAFHADKGAEILRSVGYDESTIARVKSLLKKENLKTDAGTQALEDVACLVFLENYYAEFAPKHDEEKVIGILRRTWTKMSDKAREAALKLEIPAQARGLIEKALAADRPRGD